MNNGKLLLITASSSAILAVIFFSLLSQVGSLSPSSAFNKTLTSINYKIKTLGDGNSSKAGAGINSDKSVIANSLEAKQENELVLNKIAANGLEVFSEKKLYELLIKKGAKVDSDLAIRMQVGKMTPQDRELVNTYWGQLLSEEENFKIELKQYSNFQELKNATDKRSKENGIFYGNDLLNEFMAYKDVKFEDIKSVLNSGAQLPNDVMSHLVFTENIDLAVKLKEAGYNIDVNYYDKFQSMNAIELMANVYATNPYSATADEQISNIKKLVDLGVPLKVNDGTRDALDRALEGVTNQNPDQAQKLLELAKNLHSLGMSMEQSHYQLLNQIKNKYPELYNQYISDFQ